MKKLLSDFITNLSAGLRLAFFRRCSVDDFKLGCDQLVLLLAFDLLLENLVDYTRYQPDAEFDVYALPVYSLHLGCFFLAAYLVGKLARNSATPMRIAIMLYSFGPLTILADWLLEYAGRTVRVQQVFSLYIILLLSRMLYLATDRRKITTVLSLLLMLWASVIPDRYYPDYTKFWYAMEEDADEQEKDPYAAYRDMDAEQLMYRQPEILEAALGQLTPQRKKVSELFFVGFAPYAHQNVFSKEVAYAKQLLDERFDTRGHSINLVNHLETRDRIPLANATNLALTLQRIGKLMNPEEDVLLLYLTSHGSQDQELAVDFWPLALNQLTPEKLKVMLDEAGIKWRVVIVSACYSGGFVKALQGPGTLVATAAAADRTSFGCGNRFNFTYFGEALFKDQLQQRHSIIAALQQAEIEIGAREKREKLEPSLPQLFVGKAIEPKLQRLSKELDSRLCSAKTQQTSC